MGTIDEKTRQDFLIYANSVIKSRAIPSAEDNLKPIHRRILWSMYDHKFYDDKPTVKSAKVVGNVMGELHPHGDASIYEAIVRLGQWWKLRYPLVFMQGNCGNILGDGAAASRYTECRLSKLGMFMLEDINKDCVEWRENFDNSSKEPVTLPSKFPYLLCGNNSGIAVGMGSDLVSHNFTEVSQAITYYMEHKDCTIADLMQFIKGPDFPTGGKIINGEELLDIYSRGTGSVKVCSHYEISKKGKQTLITFTDLPYGVEIDDGIKKPLKKLVLDDGYEVFEDISVLVKGRDIQITVTLGKDADVAKCLEILFNKTKLMSSIKINQNLIVDGEPRVLNLKEMIKYWVNYRSNCIRRIASNDYLKTNHKLTVVLGLKKCLSDIDKLVNIIRQASDRAAAKMGLMKEFELNDEQVEAVLDMKLSRLSRLDLAELDKDERDLTDQLALQQRIIDDETMRYDIIKADLAEIKKVVGKDDRLTEIYYARPSVTADKPVIKQEYRIADYGIDNSTDINLLSPGLVDVVFAYGQEEILGYNARGEISPIASSRDYIGACVKDKSKDKLVTVTKNGNIKVSLLSDYKLTKANEKLLKLKEDDALLYAALCSDKDYIMLFDGNQNVLKLAIADLPVASKLTLGVKSGFAQCTAAVVVNDSDLLLFVTTDLKGKYTSVQDFSVDNRGNKGQKVVENTMIMRRFDANREQIYLIPKTGKVFTIPRTKLSIKGRTAIGASLTSRPVARIL